MSTPDPASIESLLQSVAVTSAAFAERATYVSETIERVETALCELPGKTPLEVSCDGVTVSFDKHKGRWGLWLVDEESYDEYGDAHYQYLTTVSVTRKARALPLVLELLPKLAADQQRQIAEIDKSIGSINRNVRPPKSLKPKPLLTPKDVEDTASAWKRGNNHDVPLQPPPSVSTLVSARMFVGSDGVRRDTLRWCRLWHAHKLADGRVGRHALRMRRAPSRIASQMPAPCTTVAFPVDNIFCVRWRFRALRLPRVGVPSPHNSAACRPVFAFCVTQESDQLRRK